MALNTDNKQSIKLDVKTESCEIVAESSTNHKQSIKLDVKTESCKIEAEGSTNHKQSFKLADENELRIKVGGSSEVKIELSSGFAEVFGTEMEINKVYSLLRYSYVTVFTWHGCVINVRGNPEVACVVKKPHMMLNVLLHASIEERRQYAEAENKDGPVVLVVGPNDFHKSSLCRILLNYAVRLGHHPLFIDLDVGQSSISLPGSVGVLVAKKPADIFTGFNNQEVEVYHYGDRSAWQYMIKYFLLVQRLGIQFRSDVKYKNRKVRTSGVIISGCDWSKCEVNHHGFDSITLVTKHFQIDVVCVLQEEALYSLLRKDLPSNVEVVFIPKIDEYAAKRSQRDAKTESRVARMNEYFHGLPNQLQSFTFEVKYSDIKVLRLVARSVARYTAFMDSVREDEVQIISEPISFKLLDVILSVSSADEVRKDIMYLPVVGFVCVVKVDLERQALTLLSPQPGPLSKKILLKGERLKKCE